MKRSRKTAVQIIGGVLLAAVLSGRGQPDFSEKEIMGMKISKWKSKRNRKVTTGNRYYLCENGMLANEEPAGLLISAIPIIHLTE